MKTNPETRVAKSDQQRIDSMFWRHWLFITGVPVVATVVLAASVLIVGHLLPEVWPWPGTDKILAVALYVMIVVFAVYATYQQKRMMALRDNLMEARYRVREVNQQHRSRLLAICAVSEAIGDEADPRRVFDKLTHVCRDVFCSDRASLMVFEHRTGRLVVRSAVGMENADQVIGTECRLGEGVAGWVALNRQPLLLGPGLEAPRFNGQRHQSNVRSAMIVPLEVRGKVAGVLSVANDESLVDYDQDDLTTLKVFSETAEYCIRHAETSDWMRGLILKLQDLRHESARSLSGRHVVVDFDASEPPDTEVDGECPSKRIVIATETPRGNHVGCAR